MSDEFVAAVGITPARSSPTSRTRPTHDLADATAENVDRFRQELEARGVEGVVERLPGTSHASLWPICPCTAAAPPNVI